MQCERHHFGLRQDATAKKTYAELGLGVPSRLFFIVSACGGL